MITCLIDSNQEDLVNWTTEVHFAIIINPSLWDLTRLLCLLQILTQVITQRNRIINETDNNDDELDNDDDTNLPHSKEPSAEALAKITDYSETEYYVGLTCFSLFLPRVVIPCTSDKKADAVTKNPNLKLLFRLSKFHILDEGETNYRVWLSVIDP